MKKQICAVLVVICCISSLVFAGVAGAAAWAGGLKGLGRLLELLEKMKGGGQ